jgi:phospholipid transport system transporter-binding protein
MSVATLKLPESVRMSEVSALWKSLENSLRSEGVKLRGTASAGASALSLSLSGVALKQFDTSLLSLLLSASRCCNELGLHLQLQDMPAKLLELARVYGVAELLWPGEPDAAAAQAATQLA